MSAGACGVAVFVRPIVAGATKTRLIPALGAPGAAALYEAFVRDTVDAVRGVPGLAGRCWVAGAPDDLSLSECAPELPRRRQPEVDLGERIAAALDEELDLAEAAVAIGSDAPTLPPSYLARAARALERSEFVIGPAADGGFYALGARRAARRRLRSVLAQVRWSSRHAGADTVRAIRAAGCSLTALAPWYDVDGPADLALLRLELDLAPEAAPATARLLTSWLRATEF